MGLPEKLTALRKEKGLTQLELAQMLQVSRQAISKWESGVAAPGIDSLKLLGDLYGVTIDFLVRNDVPPSRPAPEPEESPKLPERPAAPTAEPAPETPMLSARRLNPRDLIIGALLTLLLLTALALGLCLGRLRTLEQERREIIPVENLEKENMNEDTGHYNAGTFSFDEF